LVTKAMYLYKIEFDNAARQFGGTTRNISQHSILWGASGNGGFDPDFWLGVCAGLSIEWIKHRVRGEDFIAKLLQERQKLMSIERTKNEGLGGFARDVEGSHYKQNQVHTALRGVCTPDGTAAEYSLKNLPNGFARDRYHYVSTGSHAMAAYVSDKGKVDFYDPNVGEATGLSSTRFFTVYLTAALGATGRVTGDAIDLKAKRLRVLRLRTA
jgi:hypothetical protein